MAISFLAGGGDRQYMPILKYDARSGTFNIRVRDEDTQTWDDQEVDRHFAGVWDFENFKIGWADFANSPPDIQMVHHNDRVPAQPTADHKRGVQILVKMPKALGGEVRELLSTAAVFREGFNALHSEYVKQAPANPGKLPVITMEKTINKALKQGGAKNHVPVFKIVKWVDRPEDLGAADAGEEPAKASAPPSTGSKKVSAPVVDDEDDFG